MQPRSVYHGDIVLGMSVGCGRLLTVNRRHNTFHVLHTSQPLRDDCQKKHEYGCQLLPTQHCAHHLLTTVLDQKLFLNHMKSSSSSSFPSRHRSARPIKNIGNENIDAMAVTA
eukprot:COSAG01_NODE_471_length_16555_cov_14.196524_11_plen_113_part_00